MVNTVWSEEQETKMSQETEIMEYSQLWNIWFQRSLLSYIRYSHPHQIDLGRMEMRWDSESEGQFVPVEGRGPWLGRRKIDQKIGSEHLVKQIPLYSFLWELLVFKLHLFFGIVLLHILTFWGAGTGPL